MSAADPAPLAADKPQAPSVQPTATPAIQTEPGIDSATAAPIESPIGALLSGWMTAASVAAANLASSVSTPKAPREVIDASPESDSGVPPAAAEAGATAQQWMSDAGKLWEVALEEVGGRLEAARLDEKMGALRDQSSVFMDGVTKNLSAAIGDGDAIRERTSQIETSAKGLLVSASQQIQTRTKEALEIFVDAPGGAASIAAPGAGVEVGVTCAPWDAASLPESEHKFADALREAMLKLTTDSIYSKKKRTALFLSGEAASSSFLFDADANSKAAIAALEVDTNLRRLRTGLVPQKISERVFWDEYFHHVQRLRGELVANSGILPSTVEDDVAAIFEDHDDEAEVIPNINSPRVHTRRAPASLDSSPMDFATYSADPGVGTAASADRTSEKTGVNTGILAAVPSAVRDWENEIDALFEEDEK
jgi:BSD domain